jgi:hypothetical protein
MDRSVVNGAFGVIKEQIGVIEAELAKESPTV